MRWFCRLGTLEATLILTMYLIIPQITFAQTSPDGPANLSDNSVKIPDDLSLLVGKRVIIGRMPLCTPKTYSANLSYSGKVAKIISFSRNTSMDVIRGKLRSLPASTQMLLANQMKGGIVLFEFEDGNRLDNCGSMGWDTISSQIELAPGESVLVPATVQNGSIPTSVSPPLLSNNADLACPISIVALKSGVSFAHALAEALTTSEFEQQLDETTHNGHGKHYLDLTARNNSGKLVSAFEFRSVYFNKMGDNATSSVYISQNSRSIPPGEELKSYAMDRDNLQQSGTGQVEVYISRVKFDDGTFWKDDGGHACSRKTNIE